MDLFRIVSPVFNENCYVLVPAQSGGALVVDPGGQVAPLIFQLLDSLQVRAQAVLLTHGHPDHCWDAEKVSAHYDHIPVYLAGPDHHRLADPVAACGVLPAAAFDPAVIGPWHRPENLQDLPGELLVGGGAALIEGLALRAVPAPGHSEGSTVFLGHAAIRDRGQQLGIEGDSAQPFLLGGDVIFQGSIGRTDLKGSDPQLMEETLRTLRQVIDPATHILPGHGFATTMGQEIAHNPFLK